MRTHDRQGETASDRQREAAAAEMQRPSLDSTPETAVLQFQRSAGNAAVSAMLSGLTVQRQKTPGIYVVDAKARLRGNETSKRSVLAKITKGTPAKVIPNDGKKSVINVHGAGKVENSWSLVPDAGPGWIRDTHLIESSLAKALGSLIDGPTKPTLKLLQDLITWAPPEQKKGAADDEPLLARVRKAVGRDTYLLLLPAFGVHRTPNKTEKSTPGSKGHLTGPEADKAIRAELEKEVALAVKAGRSVEGEVSVVGDEDFQEAFDRQWVEAAGQKQYDKTTSGKNSWEFCEAFVDVNLPGRHIWVHRNFGDLGTVVHEGMHKYADSRLRDEQIQLANLKGISHGGTSRLDEGITEFFTKPVVLNQLKVPRANYYQGEFMVASKLASRLGRQLLVDAYFNGAFDGLKNAIGLSKWPEFAERLERSDWKWLRENGHV